MKEGTARQSWCPGAGACVFHMDIVHGWQFGNLSGFAAAAADSTRARRALPFLSYEFVQRSVRVWESAVRVDGQFAGLVDEGAEGERGVAAVHHHTHPLDGLGGAPSGGAPPRLLVPGTHRVGSIRHAVGAGAVGRCCRAGVGRPRVGHTVLPEGLHGMQRRGGGGGGVD